MLGVTNDMLLSLEIFEMFCIYIGNAHTYKRKISFFGASMFFIGFVWLVFFLCDMSARFGEHQNIKLS